MVNYTPFLHIICFFENIHRYFLNRKHYVILQKVIFLFILYILKIRAEEIIEENGKRDNKTDNKKVEEKERELKKQKDGEEKKEDTRREEETREETRREDKYKRRKEK